MMAEKFCRKNVTIHTIADFAFFDNEKVCIYGRIRMIRVALCDDEKQIVSRMDTLLMEICRRENIAIETDAFYCGYALEKEITAGKRYDLIYLDIQMENGDGIKTAGNIRETDEDALLIYVSGYEKYMIELFRLDVFAFIRKPLDEGRFETTFLEANRKICNRKVYFSFSYQSVEQKVICMEILYFESRGRKIIVHLKEGRTEVFNGKLSEVEGKLQGGKIPFLRIHQSYYVNYHHIRSRSKAEVTLINGEKLPISEERKKEFGRQYNKLLGDEINI